MRLANLLLAGFIILTAPDGFTPVYVKGDAIVSMLRRTADKRHTWYDVIPREWTSITLSNGKDLNVKEMPMDIRKLIDK